MVPVTGAGISTVLVGHHVDKRVSSRIVSPILTCQATISASVPPSPISGNLTTY